MLLGLPSFYLQTFIFPSWQTSIQDTRPVMPKCTEHEQRSRGRKDAVCVVDHNMSGVGDAILSLENEDISNLSSYVSDILTTCLSESLRVRHHVLKTKRMGTCNFVQIQELSSWDPFLEVFRLTIARRVWHKPGCIQKDYIFLCIPQIYALAGIYE